VNHRIKILVVDNEPRDRALLEALLSPCGYETILVASGQEALEKVAGIQPDIILLDLIMPKMSGFEVLQKLRAQEATVSIPTIVISSLQDSENRTRAFDAGCDEIVSKPFDRTELLARIKSLLRIKHYHDEIEDSNKRLKAAESVKDEFISTVSHELRTPLTAIKSSIDILDTEAPGKLTNDQKIFIKRVKSNIDRLARLINDVLDLSKLEAGKMVLNLLPLHLEAIIQEVVETHAQVAESRGMKIRTEFKQKLPVLMADKDRLIQVLNNLISNALKFTKEGEVVILVHCEDKQHMTFCVRDTGIGIKEEDIPKLFEKFQQVGGPSQHTGGTGLGLTICKQIIAKHNGLMWVESQFGQGSAFYFTIPLRKEKRILIVDDDRTTLETLRAVVEEQGCYEIEMASDGFLAGQKYSDFAPHLIILDINLPKINGLEVCMRIKNDLKNKSTKIIMISAFDTELKKKEAWNAGADEVLSKPVNTQEMIAKIRKLV